MQITGIYKISNIINNKCYIGSATHIMRRLADHKRLLRNKKHHSYKLQGSYNKHGKDNFKFEVYEEVFFPVNYTKELKKEYLESLETFYIKKFDGYTKGYNVSEIAGRPGNSNTPSAILKTIEKRRQGKGFSLSEASKKLLSESLKNSTLFHENHAKGALKRRTTIYKYNLNGEYLGEICGVLEASKQLNVPPSAITKNLCNINHRCKDYILSYIKQDKIDSWITTRNNYRKLKHV